MTYLLDTDHIGILQRQSGPEFAALMAHITQHGSTELAFSIISMHEQVLGCHTYISRARTAGEVVRGYRMLAQILRDFSASPALPFDAAAATVFDGLVAQGGADRADGSSNRLDRSITRDGFNAEMRETLARCRNSG